MKFTQSIIAYTCGVSAGVSGTAATGEAVGACAMVGIGEGVGEGWMVATGKVVPAGAGPPAPRGAAPHPARTLPTRISPVSAPPARRRRADRALKYVAIFCIEMSPLLVSNKCAELYSGDASGLVDVPRITAQRRPGAARLVLLTFSLHTNGSARR